MHVGVTKEGAWLLRGRGFCMWAELRVECCYGRGGAMVGAWPLPGSEWGRGFGVWAWLRMWAWLWVQCGYGGGVGFCMGAWL